MFKIACSSCLAILFVMISPVAYGVGINSDNVWYFINMDAEMVDQATATSKVFTTFAEAEAAMRGAIKFGGHMVLDHTEGTAPNAVYRYKFEPEEVLPGDNWTYKSGYGGAFGDAQGAIDAFFEVNGYECVTEDGPLGSWGPGSAGWWCYPPGADTPHTTENATYNFQICDGGGGGVDIDPKICRYRVNHCPEHAKQFIPAYRNYNPDIFGGGEYCRNGGTAAIYEYRCKCNETGISGSCERIPTHYEMSFDQYGAYHYYLVADDQQYNPLNCPEKVEVPQINCSGGDAFRGNPVNITNGCKVQQAVDYAASGESALKVARSYASATITAGLNLPKPYAEKQFSDKTELCSGGDYQATTTAGSQLTRNYQAWRLQRRNGCPDIINLYTPNGSKYVFARMANPPGVGTWYESDDPRLGRVQRDGLNTYYYDGKGRTYNFNYDKLRWIKKDNKVTTLGYNGDNNLSSVTDGYGNVLQYAYDENGRIASIETPDGTLRYNYDDNGNLTEVIYPDDTPADETDNPRKQYLFEDGRFPNALTGIVNENGVRFASWTYDAYGRAVSSEHNGGADRYAFEYLDGKTTLVRRYLGNDRFHESIHTHGIYNGRDVVTSITPADCDDCALGKTVKKYDPLSGDLISTQDPNGVITTYEYDRSHRRIRRSVAVGTAQQRVTETVWDEALNKPLRIIEPDRITEYRYDDSGHLLSRTVRAAH